MSFATHENHFPRAPDDVEPQPAGTWRLTFDKGRPASIITCPICGAPHSISPSRMLTTGAVEYEVRCACRWVDFVTLDGWADATGIVAPTYGKRA